MKAKIFAIYDSKTEIFTTPHFMLNRGTFMRALLEVLNDKNSNLGKYPEDFTAFEVGEWDDEQGTIKMYPAKISIGNLLELMPQSKEAAEILNRKNLDQTLELQQIEKGNH